MLRVYAYRSMFPSNTRTWGVHSLINQSQILTDPKNAPEVPPCEVILAALGIGGHWSLALSGSGL